MTVLVVMSGDRCIVCGSSRAKDPDASFHRFPSDLGKKQLWIEEFGLIEGSVSLSAVHAADISGMGTHDKALGARFASPKKRGTLRLKIATKQALSSQLHALHSIQPSLNPSSSTTSVENEEDEHSKSIENRITAAIGEPLRMDYEVHELFRGMAKTRSRSRSRSRSFI